MARGHPRLSIRFSREPYTGPLKYYKEGSSFSKEDYQFYVKLEMVFIGARRARKAIRFSIARRIRDIPLVLFSVRYAN